MDLHQQAVRDWLKAFEACVNARDYEGGIRMFADATTAFGSLADRLDSPQSLMENQWRRIWPHIDAFRFDLENLSVAMSASRDLAVAGLPWTSVGYDEGGRPFERPGRATVVLEKKGDGPWRASHTHFSLRPGTPGKTRRPPAPRVAP